MNGGKLFFRRSITLTHTGKDEHRKRLVSLRDLRWGRGCNPGRGLLVRAQATRYRGGSYQIYRDVFAALESLTAVLSRSEAERKLLEHTREEWLAGVTHDLKTPLSSVMGYAEMLAAPDYAWEDQQIQQFAQVISNKAAVMAGLIDDLGLTFRLRNRAMPLRKTRQDIVEMTRRAVIDMINSPHAARQCVRFTAMPDRTILYPVNAAWFRRALENLLAIAKQLVEAHGGELSLQTSVGHGSVFLLILPCIGS